MADTQSTQTHPKFLWRFIICQKNRTQFFSITADTEQEARSRFLPLSMVFVARIRQEVAHG